MAEYKDIRAGDIFVTDYGTKAVVLDLELPETGKTERWFTSFKLDINHYDYPMKGKLVYKTSAAPGSDGSGGLTLVNADLWARHLSQYHISREQDSELSRKLLTEAKQNILAKEISISVGVYNQIELDEVTANIEQLL